MLKLLLSVVDTMQVTEVHGLFSPLVAATAAAAQMAAAVVTAAIHQVHHQAYSHAQHIVQVRQVGYDPANILQSGSRSSRSDSRALLWELHGSDI
jgi:hypothetical protein